MITPDGDGSRDFVAIHFSEKSAGLIANIAIFDVHGQHIGQLSDYELLGSNALISWNGISSNNTAIRTGLYVMYIELTDNDGSTYRFKEPIALADRQ